MVMVVIVILIMDGEDDGDDNINGVSKRDNDDENGRDYDDDYCGVVLTKQK